MYSLHAGAACQSFCNCRRTKLIIKLHRKLDKYQKICMYISNLLMNNATHTQFINKIILPGATALCKF